MLAIRTAANALELPLLLWVGGGGGGGGVGGGEEAGVGGAVQPLLATEALPLLLRHANAKFDANQRRIKAMYDAFEQLAHISR